MQGRKKPEAASSLTLCVQKLGQLQDRPIAQVFIQQKLTETSTDGG